MMKRYVTYIWFLILSLSFSKGTVFAQKSRLLLFELWIDEDYLNFRGKGTDRYYTGGLSISFFYTAGKSKKIFSLIDPKNSRIPVAFVSLKQITNTPSNIKVPGPVQNDYPYAAALFMNYGKIYTDKTKQSRLGSTISIGVTGPYAMGKEIQVFFHRVVNYTQPEGWDSQLPNDLILNYRLNYEKNLWSYHKKIELIGITEVNTGSTFNNCKVGLLVRISNHLNYFSVDETAGFNTNRNRNGRFVFSMKPQVTIVAYNALLQGSLLKKRSQNWLDAAHVIKSQDINRVIYGFAFGITYETKFAALSITQYLQSKEFSQVESHEYGNISLVFKIRNKESSSMKNE